MKTKQRILVVDDEQDLCEILQFNLLSEGYEVELAYSGEEALTKPLHKFDLLLLDVMMGGISGYRLADQIRKELQLQVPIIFLTAKSSENDLLTGFNVGGDDYISKPFSIKEVVARVKAVLKRSKKEEQTGALVSVDELVVDISSKSVEMSGEPIDLTRKEFDILTLLITNRGKYLSREDILDRIWSNDVIVTERNVDVNIARLRRKIGRFGEMIKGKTGYGYCFEN